MFNFSLHIITVVVVRCRDMETTLVNIAMAEISLTIFSKPTNSMEQCISWEDKSRLYFKTIQLFM
jgi:hypothetical protein